MRLVPIECVREGSYIGKTIYDKENRVLLHTGVELKENLIGKIKENGIYSIYINDEYSNNEIEDIVSPQIRNQASKMIKEAFKCIGKSINTSNNKMFDKKNKQMMDTHFQSIESIGKNIVDEMLSQKEIMINLVDIKSLDNYMYQHSVNVAILSMVLGIEIGLNRNQLYDLCMGALMHDIGMIFIPKEITNKKDKLTNEELNIVKEHALKGYEYLKERQDIKPSARLIALQHHERINGGGYPNGQDQDHIHIFSKIVAIVDTYDALISDRAYKKAVPQNEAIELIMGTGGRLFDFEMVKIFTKKVIPYPVGTLVELSNGEIGVVEKIEPQFPLRPIIKVVKQLAVTVEMTLIDLMKETNIVIKQIRYEIPNACVPRQLNEGNSFKNQ
ncbi:HD-GYP domain-containing protein [Lutibacter sp. B2]|nr:HD-GYP domain-containing protein [Lutibacter sp. B2]